MLTQFKAPRCRSRRSTFNAVIPASTTCKSRFSFAASVTRTCIPPATNGRAPLIRVCPVIPIQKINEAYDRVVKDDVKYRFVIDMASLKKGV
jgi:hypothetical protein